MAGLSFLRVMTFNIHGGLDGRGRPSLPDIGETVRQAQPDLAGLQEVERVFRAKAGYADQPALLARALGMDYCFAPAIDLRPGASGGKFGNAILSRWPLLSRWSALLPGGGEPRVVAGAVVASPCGRVNLLVCHLGLDREERARQIPALQNKARCLRGPAIIAGDFNVGPDAPELATLFVGWGEAQEALGMNLPTYPASSARIDYIFHSAHWRVIRARAIPSPASDHWPLVADLEPRAEWAAIKKPPPGA